VSGLNCNREMHSDPEFLRSRPPGPRVALWKCRSPRVAIPRGP